MSKTKTITHLDTMDTFTPISENSEPQQTNDTMENVYQQFIEDLLEYDLMTNPPPAPLSAAERTERLTKLEHLFFTPPALPPSFPCDPMDPYSLCAIGACDHSSLLNTSSLESIMEGASDATLPELITALGFGPVKEAPMPEFKSQQDWYADLAAILDPCGEEPRLAPILMEDGQRWIL